MKICWIPRYKPEAAASTRIRVYQLHQSLLDEGKMQSVIGMDKDADVIIVQKVANQKVLDFLEENPDKLTFFDYDDEDTYQLSHFKKVARHVDVFIVDTEGRKTQVEALELGKPIEILEDSIDYDLKMMDNPPGDAIVWFGYHTNVGPVTWQMETLVKEGYTVRAISDCDKIELPEGVSCQPWGCSTFVETLRKSSIALLSHEGQDESAKSNNKMIAAITAGLPVISGKSDNYHELLVALGLEWAHVENDTELIAVAKMLSHGGTRKAYLGRAQKPIWAKYNRRAVARKLVNIIGKYNA